MNINTADLEELDKLPGIGPATAQKIIDYRDANGSFSQISEVDIWKVCGHRRKDKLADRFATNNDRLVSCVHGVFGIEFQHAP